ncbi:amino acid transporter [Microthyrium microscopicum]|uniref:Amino acid transporter n=1 Tax=Microthyrium microscopicum TaxID=703497 RepID=A0A6A6UMY5_9PEZI|nr:amino acid transporter [Microthyrium microscopicum]
MIEAREKYGPITLGLFAIVLTGVWAFASGTLGIGLSSGGFPVLIYGSLVVGFCTSVIALCLAQYGSAHPHEAGCTLIATKLGGPEWGRLCGFYTGGFHTLAVICTPAANILVACQLVATLGTIMHPDWIPHRWQIWLIFQALNIFYVVAIKFGFRYMNWVTNIAAAFLLITFLALLGVLGKSSTGAASNDFVWKNVVNETGWSTTIGVLIGISNIMYIYGPPHWLLNMAEDVKNPSRSLPIAISIQQVGNIFTLFAFYVAGGYAITDWSALLTTTYPAPAGALFEQATKSQGGAFALLFCVVLPTLIGTMSYISANLRLVHGFAATGALPYQDWLLRMDPQGEVPTNLLYLVAIVNFLLSCIYLGSYVGFTIILSSANLLYALGFFPIFLAFILTKGRYLGRNGWFKMPIWLGMSCALFSVVYLVLTVIIYCLPPLYPVTIENMNWSCVFGIFGMIFLSVIWKAYAKTRYVGYPDLLEGAGTEPENHHAIIEEDLKHSGNKGPDERAWEKTS